MSYHLEGRPGKRKLVIGSPYSRVELGVTIARVTLETGDVVCLYLAERVRGGHPVLSFIESTLPRECLEHVDAARQELRRRQGVYGRKLRPFASHTTLESRQMVVSLQAAIDAPLLCHPVQEDRMLALELPCLETDRQDDYILQVGKVVLIEA